MTEQEMTVMLITHDLAEAEALCDRVALMHQGQIQTTGAPEHLRRRLYREQTYTLHVDVVSTAVLQTLQHIPSLAYQSNQIQLRAAGGDGVLTAVLDILRQHDIAIHHIESAPPSLEEVFNHFTNEE
jgi:ABC-2 type transport system ATP-binding protein